MPESRSGPELAGSNYREKPAKKGSKTKRILKTAALVGALGLALELDKNSKEKEAIEANHPTQEYSFGKDGRIKVTYDAKGNVDEVIMTPETFTSAGMRMLAKVAEDSEYQNRDRQLASTSGNGNSLLGGGRYGGQIEILGRIYELRLAWESMKTVDPAAAPKLEEQYSAAVREVSNYGISFGRALDALEEVLAEDAKK